MIHHFELEPTVWHAKTWRFSWNDETGEVTGPDAAEVLEISRWGGIDVHPLPFAHEFSAEPLKSKTDMAAIIGRDHRLPPELVPFYPRPNDDGAPEKTYTDESGAVVIGRDLLLY